MSVTYYTWFMERKGGHLVSGLTGLSTLNGALEFKNDNGKWFIDDRRLFGVPIEWKEVEPQFADLLSRMIMEYNL